MTLSQVSPADAVVATRKSKEEAVAFIGFDDNEG